MKNKITRIITIIMAVAVMFTACNPAMVDAATKKASLNKKAVTLTIKDKKISPSVTLKVKNARKAAKWTTNNKKAVSIKTTGKNSVKITAKKAGRAVITCKVDGRKLKCPVTVSDKRTKKGTDGTENTESTETPDTESTGNTESTENTGDTENTGNTENGGKKRAWAHKCGTLLKVGPRAGQICGAEFDVMGEKETEEEHQKFKDHMAEHLKNGEAARYTNIK